MPATQRTPRAPLAPVRAFLWLSLLGGALLLALFPPFAVADEPAHFLRSCALLEGEFFGERRGEAVGAELPVGLARLARLTDDLPFHRERKFSLERWRAGWALRVDTAEKEFVDFRTVAQVPFLLHVPQALGIGLARLAGAPPLAWAYAGRAANLVLCTALVAFALGRLPFYRWLGTIVALLPQSLSIRASLSGDALTFAVALLLVACAWRMAFGSGRLGATDRAGLLAAAPALALTKAVYLPLLAHLALIPGSRWGRRRGGAWGTRIAVALLVAASVAVAVAAFAGTNVPLREGYSVDRPAQWRGVIADPGRFAGLVASDLLAHGPRYAVQLVGRQIGWLDTDTPWTLSFALVALLLWAAATDGSPELQLSVARRALVLVATLVVALGIELSQYLTWTPVGLDAIEGVQGRYFTPLVVPTALALHSRRRAGRLVTHGRLLGAMLALAAAVSCLSVLVRFY